MELPVAKCVEDLKMPVCISSLVMALLQNLEALDAQRFCVDSHGGSMQQQALTMHLYRPLRIGAEEQRILDQNDRPACLQTGMVCKQLMGKDDGDVQSQPSPARRQARRPIDVAYALSTGPFIGLSCPALQFITTFSRWPS